MIATLAIAGSAAVTLLDATGPQRLDAMAGRDLIGYLGLTLIGWRLIGNQASAVLSVAFALAAALLGSGIGVSRVAWWAWPVATPTSGLALGLAVATLVIGLATLLRSSAAKAVRA